METPNPVGILTKLALGALLLSAASSQIQAATLEVSNSSDELCVLKVGYYAHKGLKGHGDSTYIILPKTDNVEIHTAEAKKGADAYVHWITYAYPNDAADLKEPRQLRRELVLGELKALESYANKQSNKDTNNAIFKISIREFKNQPTVELVD